MSFYSFLFFNFHHDKKNNICLQQNTILEQPCLEQKRKFQTLTLKFAFGSIIAFWLGFKSYQRGLFKFRFMRPLHIRRVKAVSLWGLASCQFLGGPVNRTWNTWNGIWSHWRQRCGFALLEGYWAEYKNINNYKTIHKLFPVHEFYSNHTKSLKYSLPAFPHPYLLNVVQVQGQLNSEKERKSQGYWVATSLASLTQTFFILEPWKLVFICFSDTVTLVTKETRYHRGTWRGCGRHSLTSGQKGINRIPPCWQ